jgi:hypothetical protein
MKLYAHSQDDALGFGGGDLSDPVSISTNETLRGARDCGVA